MTRKEREKALYALRKSAPIMAMTPNEFEDYSKTLNKIADWLEQEPCEDCRTCNKWSECECGEKGHKNGTSIGYSIGECKDYEPCDCISRAEAIEALGYDISIESDEGLDAYRTVIKEMLCKIYDAQKENIEKLPSIQPKTDVLDKIRAEIEQNAYPIVHGVNNHEKGMTLYGILQVIDKYRKEQ